ncbi:RpiB/LacA/LacB family sugar-phosphate isomerase, partial [Patescibacteria group bacterium]|nr:RpiB/LacA/LacB family sugar-phosphate isomerase [Patescibacteria group bacterium]
MKIYIASDHAGFEMKRYLIEYLSKNKHEVFDCGPEVYNQDDDYPDYISVAAHYVSGFAGQDDVRGIVIGFSGQGEAIVANRFKDVRCAV